MAGTPESIQIPMSIWGPIFTAIGGLATGAMFVWKKLSSQKLENTKNNAEVDVVQHLQSQRDDAVKTAKEHHHAKVVAEMALAEALAKMEHMSDQIESLRQRLALLNQLVGRLTAALDLTKKQLTAIIEKNSGQPLLTHDALRDIQNCIPVNLSPGVDNVSTAGSDPKHD